MKNNIGEALGYSLVYGFIPVMLMYLCSNSQAEFKTKIESIVMLDEVFIYFLVLFITIFIISRTLNLMYLNSRPNIRKFIVNIVGFFQSVYFSATGAFFCFSVLLLLVEPASYLLAVFLLFVGFFFLIFAQNIISVFPKTLQEKL